MKKIILLTTGILLCPMSVHAAQTSWGCDILECPDGSLPNPLTCSCEGGFVPPGPTPIVCDKKCPDCTDWLDQSEISPGREGRTCYELDTVSCTCMIQLDMRCAAGWYGTLSSANDVCTPCPDGGTSLPPLDWSLDGGGLLPDISLRYGNYSITDCFIPIDATGVDETGSYQISGGNCYYTTD